MYFKPNLRTNIGTHDEKRRYERWGTFADQFIWSRVKPNSFAVELATAPDHTQFIPVHSCGLSERILCARNRERTRAIMPIHRLLYRQYCTGASLSSLWWRGASGGAVEFETSLTIATGTIGCLDLLDHLQHFPVSQRLSLLLAVVAVRASS